ncbi:MAG TPA: cation:proton antiporter [Candidatus Eisenbacteria bacterium]|nr:cation:proton antiporter [Candidatus Eisenbacteria bacterium]
MTLGLAAPADLPVLSFLFALAAILVGARLGGEIATRLGQPAVLGEIVAGLILGPHALGWVPNHPIIILLAQVGVVLLLFEIGLEVDLGAMLKVGGPAIRVAVLGVVLPFLGGFLFAKALGLRDLAPIVLGATLTATSVGITARVLADLGKLQTQEARIILGAAVVDDVLGIVILSLVQRMADTGRFVWSPVFVSLLAAVGFLALALAVGRLGAHALVRLVNGARTRGALITMAVALALVLGVLAARTGSAPLIGALAAGVLLASTHKKQEIERDIRPLVDFFAPIFFVSVGAAVDLELLSPLRAENAPTLILAAGLIAIALMGKVAAGLVAGPVQRLVVGIGMIPRGEVGLLFAGVGRVAGVLDPAMFGAVVCVVLVTTLLAPPLLQWSFARPLQSRRKHSRAQA